jgi:hypothetical protein
MKAPRTYTIKYVSLPDGSEGIERTNDGFSAIELLGILEMTQLDIMAQLAGTFKPDFIKRNVVKDEGETT